MADRDIPEASTPGGVRCPGARLDGFDTTACWDDREHTPAKSCTCTNVCGEPGDSAGCCYCNHNDAYDPCPAVGFGGGAVYYSDDTLTLMLGDAREVLSTMATGSVNCVVTSPPYYGLRDYERNPDQIGLEKTPTEYVARLVDVFSEVQRVLADDGTLWLNLGDSYNNIPRGRRTLLDPALPAKSLLLIPDRVAIAMQQAGWICRNRVVWSKPNARPEPVRDRLSTRYEHVFLFTQSSRYWFDLDAIRTPHALSSIETQANARRRPRQPGKAAHVQQGGTRTGFGAGLRELNPKGANPGDVWVITTKPFHGTHFAPFPIDLPKRCIAAGCPSEGVVLDPFSGAGTTLMAARELGRNAVGIDINTKYHDITLKRMSDAPLPFGEAL